MCLCCRDEAPALLWTGLQLGAAVDALCAGGAGVVVSVSACLDFWDVPMLPFLLRAAFMKSLIILQRCAALWLGQQSQPSRLRRQHSPSLGQSLDATMNLLDKLNTEITSPAGSWCCRVSFCASTSKMQICNPFRHTTPADALANPSCRVFCRQHKLTLHLLHLPGAAKASGPCSCRFSRRQRKLILIMLAGVSILIGLIVAFSVLASLLRKGQHHQTPSSNQEGLTAEQYANYDSCSWSQWRLPTGETDCWVG